MSPLHFDAVIFDLDGVITQTALVHSHAWKKMFDDYLHYREKTFGEPFREFTREYDYLRFVDGKPRYDGVKSFLESRKIHLPMGTPDDDEQQETICGLGNRKNTAFNEVLAKEGVSVYDSTVALIHELKKQGVRVGVASSSKNCRMVLEVAGLLPVVETIVDGVVSAETGLKGKPAPDIFLTACKNLGAKPHRAVVVEDASSGVAAGKAGNFGLVIGIAREQNSEELYLHGADYVVNDLLESGIDRIERWFTHGLDEDNFSLTYHVYEPEKERTREALLTVGNGYMGTRGAMEENTAGPVHYPGTYIAGLYNRLKTPVAGREVENEDFVNIPDWTGMTFKINEGQWFDINHTELLSYERKLDFRTGLLTRRMVVRSSEGHESMLISQRFASMFHPHLAAIRYMVKPLNYEGKITFRAGLNGHIINDNVERYRKLNQQHLQSDTAEAAGLQQLLSVKTTQSGINIVLAATYSLFLEGKQATFSMNHEVGTDTVYSQVTIPASRLITYTLEKKVAIYTNKHDDVKDPVKEAREAIGRVSGFDRMLQDSREEWKEIWKKTDIRIEGDRFSQKLIRMHLYHLMVSMSPHNQNIDAGITARGLHGEAYRGHIFWDDIFILPVYDFNLPETARAMIMYRYNRLDKAREYAANHGYHGAMFPWQSGSDGREETQVIHLNPLSGKWDPDHSCLQRHVSLAVAFNVWQYIHITGDQDFLKDYGAELFLEICRFWASKCQWNDKTARYDIRNVMGPDEFHESYPGAEEGGLTNNAYTNLMVAWCFVRAAEMIKTLGTQAMPVMDKINLSPEELELWDEISHKLALSINEEGIIAQYEGYFDLKELDWEYYRQKYGNIHRMDRILKSEGLSPDEYKVSKQADMLMIFYNLEPETLDGLIERLGYKLPPDYLQRNLEYYFKRTSHGSTLSRIVHSRLAALAGDRELSWKLYADALSSDYNDIQGGTTAEGIHAGVMGGTIMIALSTFAGLKFNHEELSVQPSLPEHWESMKFAVTFKGKRHEFDIRP